MTIPPSANPYRNEIDALRERKETLEREITRLKEQTTHLEVLRSREQELAQELAGVAQKLGAAAAGQTRRRVPLPMLDQVKVASPCNASWDEMLGDDRVRFCVSCEKNVYNLSAMPREEGERLLQERVGDNELCVRFYQRADGTLMTQDCPVGVKKKQRKKLALAVAGAGALALAATTALMPRGIKCGMGEMQPVQGGVSAMPTPPETATPIMGEIATPPPSPPEGNWIAGGLAPPPPPPPKVTPPKSPPPHVMGRRAK